ncbi:MAG: transcriptional repressor, partial [Dehalococcoidia bacterium]|nr:transcriptional repressor [Dehalococcoidia bacterium]
MQRRTRQKDSIIRVLKSTTSHPGADWIYEQVRKEIPNVSLGTVYRNLKRMAEAGEIMELSCFEDISRFDGNMDNHYHFRCDGCGRVLDVDEPVDREIETRVARRTGLMVTGHRLELRGLCTACRLSHEGTTAPGWVSESKEVKRDMTKYK